MHKPAKARRYDFSMLGRGNDINSGIEDDSDSDHDDGTDSIVNARDSDGKVVVQKMSLELFRSKLMRHFGICFQNKELVWPKRIKSTKKFKIISLYV